MSGRWWRAYSRARHDPKLLKLSDRLFRWWFSLVCVAADNEGVLPPHADLAVEFRVSGKVMTEALDALVEAGLFDHDETGIHPHNWNGLQYKSDVSNERVKRYRERQCNVTRNVTVTPSETDTEQIQSSEAKASAPDVASIVFNQAREWLVSNTGRSDQECRRLLGKWRKSSSDADIIAAVGNAQKIGAVEPIGFIEGALKANQKAGASAPVRFNG